MSVVVSFCRPKERGNLVAVLDPTTGERRWLDFAPHTLYSARGIASDERALYVAGITASKCAIAIFDRPSLILRDLFELDDVTDIHSICLDGKAIIAASTGTDQVIRVTHDGVNQAAETVWSPSREHRDVHHVNAVAFYDGALFCCAFGPKKDSGWKSAREGYIYDVTNARIAAAGFYHPHSITAYGDDLYLCESTRATVCSIPNSGDASAEPARRVAQLQSGYARGLGFANDGTFYIGESVGRTDGTDALVGNWDDPGQLSGRCAVHKRTPNGTYDPASPSVPAIDFSDAALEIYDILCLE